MLLLHILTYYLLSGTSDGSVAHPGGVKDSHLLNTTETGVKLRLHGPPGS